MNNETRLCNRFRGFYPVVIDVETAGFNAKTDALLEIGLVTLNMNNDGWLYIDNTFNFHIIPFPGSLLNQESLSFNCIDPYSSLRRAVTEYDALNDLFKIVNKKIKEYNCKRAILVAHNAAFDHSFLMAAIMRSGIKNNPFHTFSTFDTASLSGLILGQTVLAKACNTAGIVFNNKEAHTALYDTQRTAILFCELVNRWKRFGGWPIIISPLS